MACRSHSTQKRVKEEGAIALCQLGLAAQRAQNTLPMRWVEGKGGPWTNGCGALATLWGPAAESAPRLASFTGAPPPPIWGLESRCGLPRGREVPRPLGSQGPRERAGRRGLGGAKDCTHGTRAPLLARQEENAWSRARRLPLDPRGKLKNRVPVLPGPAGCTPGHTAARTHKGPGDAVVRTSYKLLSPSDQCDPTLFPNGPSVPFHAIVRAAI